MKNWKEKGKMHDNGKNKNWIKMKNKGKNENWIRIKNNGKMEI